MSEPMTAGIRARIDEYLVRVDDDRTIGDVYLREALAEVDRLRAELATHAPDLRELEVLRRDVGAVQRERDAYCEEAGEAAQKADLFRKDRDRFIAELAKCASAWEQQRDEHGADSERLRRNLDQFTVALEMQGKAAAYDRCANEVRVLLAGGAR